MPIPQPVAVPVPPAAVKPQVAAEVVRPSMPVMTPLAKPKRKILEDLDRPVTPQELQEANEYLKLGKGFRPGKDIDTAQGVRELRKDILEGRVKATEQRKRELGLSAEVRVRTPPKEIKIKNKIRRTKEQFEKYLETAQRLDEQKRKRLAESINDVMKGAEQ
jgi:hypothetical protein